LPNIRPLNSKGGEKSRVAGQFAAEFRAERARKGPKSRKLVFLLFLSLILGKSKKSYTFPTDTDKIVLFLKTKTPSKRKKFWRFFPRRLNFSAELAGKVCQELAAHL
jgi:hypothetical protein